MGAFSFVSMHSPLQQRGVSTESLNRRHSVSITIQRLTSPTMGQGHEVLQMQARALTAPPARHLRALLLPHRSSPTVLLLHLGRAWSVPQWSSLVSRAVGILMERRGRSLTTMQLLDGM